MEPKKPIFPSKNNNNIGIRNAVNFRNDNDGRDLSGNREAQHEELTNLLLTKICDLEERV